MSFVGNRKAPVWKYFQDTEPADKDKCVCKGCKKVVPCKNGGTTNVETHLRNHHAVEYSDLKKTQQQRKRSHAETLLESDTDADELDGASGSGAGVFSPPQSPLESRPSSSLSDGGRSTPTPSLEGTPLKQQKLESYRPLDQKQMAKCHMAVTYYIVSCMRPLNTVDKKGFRLMCKALNPKYKPMSRRTLTGTYLPKTYEATKENVCLIMKEADFIAFTTDIWTSQAHDSFLALTAHFLDSDWVLVEVTLNCKQLIGDHTGPVVSAVLSEMFQEWKVEVVRVSAFTTDNADNIRVAIRALSDLISHIRCFAHTVNNGVTDVLKDCVRLTAALAKAHTLRTWISGEKVWRHYQKHIQSRYQKKPRKLPTPCKTRWWIDLNIAEAVVGQYSWMLDFTATYERGKHMGQLPSREDISIMKAFIKALKPIEKICTFLCGSKYPTCSLVLPMIYLLDPESASYGGEELVTANLASHPAPTDPDTAAEDSDEGDDPPDDDDDDIPLSSYEALEPKAIHAKVVAKLKKRFAPDGVGVPAEGAVDCHEVLTVCSYLDTRYKSEILDTDVTLAKGRLKAEAESGSVQVTNRPQQPVHTGGSSISAVVNLFRKRRLLQQQGGGGADGDGLGLDTENAAVRSLEQEMARYDLLPPIEVTDNPFAWWKDHQTTLPTLARFAKKYLIIPATSVPSESTFSGAGDIITDTRTCLTGEHSEQLLFCAQNDSYMPLPV